MKKYLLNIRKMVFLTLVGMVISSLSFAQYGTNLTVNPGFESGANTNWTKKFLDTSTGNITDSDQADAFEGTKAAKIEVTKLPTSQLIEKMMYLADAVTITESKGYKFSLKAKSLAGGSNIKISILTATAGGATKASSSSLFTLTTEYKEYAYIYTPAQDYFIVTLRIQIDGDNLDTYFFDNVAMQSVDGIANNGFEEGVNFSWAYEARDGAVATFEESTMFSAGSKALAVNVTTAGAVYDYVTAVNETRVPVVAGNPYKLTFYAKASAADMDIKAGATFNDVNNAYLTVIYDFVPLTTEYQKYEVFFKPVANATSSKVKLWAAGYVGTIYLDEFSITPAESAPLKITSRPLTTGKVNVAYSSAVMVNQDATLELSTNPQANWLTLTNGVLSGTPTEAGSVEVTITAKANGETDAQQKFTIVVKSDINTQVENIDLASLTVYPNPSLGSFQIQNTNENVNVKIYNTIGKLILNKEVQPNELINLDEKGIYIVKISNENSELTRKLIVE